MITYVIIAIVAALVLAGLAKSARLLNRQWAKKYKEEQYEMRRLRQKVWRLDATPWTWQAIEWRLAMPILCVIRVLGWVLRDAYIRFWAIDRKFPHYGIRVYEGRMGAGKTSAMQLQVQKWRYQYPKIIVVSNYKCAFADYEMTGWEDFFRYTNGEQGVVFLIDEISSLWDSMSYKEFPPELLQEIVQQRKDRKIVLASAQHFMRIVKPIREQAYEVVRCSTLLGRFSIQTAYDGYEYEKWHDAQFDPKTNRRGSMTRLWRQFFILTDEIFASYDTYEKIKMMAKDALKKSKEPKTSGSSGSAC